MKNPSTRVYIGNEPTMKQDWFRFIIDGQELQQNQHSVQITMCEDWYKMIFLKAIRIDCVA